MARFCLSPALAFSILASSLLFAACSAEDDGGSASSSSGGASNTGGTLSGSGGSGGLATGGTGGGVGTGGAVASGGGPAASACDAHKKTGGTDALIDDLEDGDAQIRQVDERTGSWFVYNDGTIGAVQTPPSPETLPTAIKVDGAHSGTKGFVSTATGFVSNYGAGFGLALNPSGTFNCTYDSSAFEGIRFWVKAPAKINVKGKEVSQKIKVQVPMIDLVPTTRGGACPATAKCDDVHTYILKSEQLTGTWELVEIRWSELEQGGWGLPADFDPARITAIQWAVETNPGAYDIKVDDVEFIGGAPGGTAGMGGDMP